MAFRFHIPQYLTRRAADWQARGFTETLVDFPTLNARSKFWGDDQRAAFKNWEEVSDMRNPLGGRQGVNERIMLRELLRRVDMMVILENHLDALVRLHTPLPPGKIGGPIEPGTPQNLRPESFYGPNAGLTEVLIPAGYVRTVYDPVFALSDDRTQYAAHRPTRHRAPGAGAALLAGVPRRAGQGGRPPARRLELRGRLPAPHPAAGVRAPPARPDRPGDRPAAVSRPCRSATACAPTRSCRSGSGSEGTGTRAAWRSGSARSSSGQGIVTALGQIAAEELDVAWSRIQVVPASTDGSPDEGFTAGSRSVMDSGSALRTVCAQVRHLLLAVASARSGHAVESLHVHDGEVRDTTGTVHGSYWTLLRPEDLDVAVDDGTARPRTRPCTRWWGTACARPDLDRKLTGAPAFVHDLRLPGQLFGRVVRPPSPAPACSTWTTRPPGHFRPCAAWCGRAASSASSPTARRRRSGPPSCCGPEPGGRSRRRCPVDPDWVERLVGQPAEVSQVARREDPAAAARVVDGPPRHVRPRLPGPRFARVRGPPSHGGTATTSRCGPTRRASTPCGGPSPPRLDLDPERVTVQHAEGAGCYGHNSADDVALDAVLLARAVPGHPVQVVWSREDEFAWEPFSPAMVAEVAAGIDASGDLVTWEQHAWSNGHDSRPGFFGQPGLLGAWHAADAPVPAAADPPLSIGGGTGRNAVPAYAVAELDVHAHRLLQSPLRTSALRGLGATVNVFAIESAMDELAERAGVDPLEYRLRHLRDERARTVLETAADGVGLGRTGSARTTSAGAWATPATRTSAGTARWWRGSRRVGDPGHGPLGRRRRRPGHQPRRPGQPGRRRCDPGHELDAPGGGHLRRADRHQPGLGGLSRSSGSARCPGST